MTEQSGAVGHRRSKSALIFTATNGRTVSESASHRSPSKHATVPQVLPQSLTPAPPRSQRHQQRFNESPPWQIRRVSATPGDPFNSAAVPSRFDSHNFYHTPARPPRSLNFTNENLLPRTPSHGNQHKCIVPSSAKKIKQRAAMKLKALENERSEAARFEQDRGDFSLQAQEKAYMAWLNHVLLGPMKSKSSQFDVEGNACGVSNESSSKLSSMSDLSYESSMLDFNLSPVGKRTPRVDKRNPSMKALGGKQTREINSLDSSFQAICSIPVLRNRLEPFVDSKSREDIIATMINVSRHIDEGRLKMKDGCTILTDVALRENFIQTMLSYNSTWLKVGLHAVLGHSALLAGHNFDFPTDNTSLHKTDEDEVETENAFLRMIIEKHFLSHSGIAKHYASNKKIEGLYKNGYNESLSRVILKRVLLFVLTLDKAKSQKTLPLACGIDGLDGGSPSLFDVNGKIKSSRQALQEFLLSSMHGEGDIIGHLGVLGYQLSHMQCGLSDYDFKVTHLVEDLQDGVRLCRLVQVLLNDTSLLMKIKLPSDRSRRRNHNCCVFLERLARAGVPLFDSYGCIISADDIVEGNREKIMSLLWNVILYVQVPKLVCRQKLSEEIVRLWPNDLVSGQQDDPSLINLLLLWIETVCANYGLVVKNFTTSFADGQALCYLIAHYLPSVLPRTSIQSVNSVSLYQSTVKPHCMGTLEHKTVTAHNLTLFIDAIKKLGCIPEVLSESHFVDDNPFVCQECIIILLSFAYYRLIEDSPKIEDKITTWNVGLEVSDLKDDRFLKGGTNTLEERILNLAATKIQCAFKTLICRQEFLKKKRAAIILQIAVRDWLRFKHNGGHIDMRRREGDDTVLFQTRLGKLPQKCCSENEAVSNMEELYESAVIVIQANIRGWLIRAQNAKRVKAAIQLQRCWRCRMARKFFLNQKMECIKIQRQWRIFSTSKIVELSNAEALAAINRIQAYWLRYRFRKLFLQKRAAAVLIQSHFRSYLCRKKLKKIINAILTLQTLAKGFTIRKQYQQKRRSVSVIQRQWRSYLTVKQQQEHAATKIQSCWRNYQTRQNIILERSAAVLIQSFVRAYIEREKFKKIKYNIISLQLRWKSFLALKKKRVDAAAKIQSCWRCYQARQNFILEKQAATLIQSFVRAYIENRKYKNFKNNVIRLQIQWRSYLAFKHKRREAATKIQSFWRYYQSRQNFVLEKKSATVIQSFVRTYIERRKYRNLKYMAVRLQVQWRSYLALKQQREIAAIKIQSWWKQCQARRSFIVAREAGVLIQNTVRMYRERKRFQKLLLSTIRLQSFCRMICAKKRFILQREAAITIQKYARARAVRSRYLELKACVVKIQALVRSKSQQRHFHKTLRSAVMIQESWRRYQMSKRMQQENRAALTIQASFRCFVEKRRYIRLYDAVVRIQAVIRGIVARRKYLMFKKCLVKIQALFRSRQQMRNYQKVKKSVTTIQAFYWSKKAHENYIQTRKAAILIQRKFREFVLNRKLLLRKQNIAAKRIQYAWRVKKSRRAAATLVQSHYRGWRQRQFFMVEVRKNYDHEHSGMDRSTTYEGRHPSTQCVNDETLIVRSSVLRIQLWWREILCHRNKAATVIQCHVRGWRARIACRKRKLNITIIQALWRGILVRNRSDNMKEGLSELRQRMHSTAANADKKMRLENRLTEALTALLSQKTVSGILHTCATIDLATQHSKLCCERLLQAGAIPKLLQLIQTTNRSPPHEEILKHSLSILGNLSRYPEIAVLVASNSGFMSIMAEQILRNNEEVLSKVMRLLQLVCKVPSGLDAIKRKPILLKRLFNLCQVLEKKVEVEARGLGRLPQNAPPMLRKLGEKKVTDAVSQHHAVVVLLQAATGEDLQTKLKAVKRLSNIFLAPAGPRLSMSSRHPLQDCSNH